MLWTIVGGVVLGLLAFNVLAALLKEPGETLELLWAVVKVLGWLCAIPLGLAAIAAVLIGLVVGMDWLAARPEGRLAIAVLGWALMAGGAFWWLYRRLRPADVTAEEATPLAPPARPSFSSGIRARTAKG